MSETIEQYRERLAGYVKDKDPLSIQRQTAAQLAVLIAEASEQELTTRPAAEKWSVVEILAHLAEDEIVTSWRYRQMIEADGCSLAGFDQDLWARLGKYRNWNASEALELFRLLRGANLRMLDSLLPAQWQCSGEHAERGRMTVADLARHMAAHDVNHIKQVETLLQRTHQQHEQYQEQDAKSSLAAGFSPQEVAHALRRMPVVLRELISALPAAGVGHHPGPRKWCIKEVVGHLTEEDKRDFVGRIEKMLAGSKPHLNVNDQAQVARERNDCDKSINELLDEFASTRAASAGFVQRLSLEDLDRGGVHPQIGLICIRELLHEWVYHDMNHLRQAEGNAQSFLWNHLGKMQGFYTS